MSTRISVSARMLAAAISLTLALAAFLAFGASGNSAFAQDAGLTKPSNIQYTTDAAGAVTVSYTPGENALGHLILWFNDDFSGEAKTGHPVGNAYTFNGITPGDYVAVVVAYDAAGDYVYELALVHIAEALSCEEQHQDRAYLCEPVRPVAPAYIDWRWNPGQGGFRELSTDFTIHNDVGDWSDQHGLYLILIQNSISDVGFYFGLQTDTNRRGKGVLFSRWKTDDLANARWDATDGWYELGRHEGGFLGVRRAYDWGAGDYRIRMAPGGLESDGEWFGLWITDLATNETTWIGSLKFPLKDATATIKPYSSATIELYGNSEIRAIDVPQWHVSVKRPVGDGVPATWGFTNYPFDDRDNPMLNSNVRYDESEETAHIHIGGLTKRKDAAVPWIVFKPLGSLADLERGAWLEENKPASANRFKALPWVADGVDETEREAAELLIATAIWHPDTFDGLLQLPWLADSITTDETEAVFGIRWSARRAPQLVDRILEKPWVQDGITRDEALVIYSLYWTIRVEDESLQEEVIQKIIEILNMPFLDTVESTDAMAVRELERLEDAGSAEFLQRLAHPTLSDGITDDEAKIVRPAGHYQ